MSTPSPQDHKLDKTVGFFPGPPLQQPPPIPPLMPAPSTFGGPCVHTHGDVPSWSKRFIVTNNGDLLPYDDTSELDIAKKPEESLPEVITSLNQSV
jgi:hypothetical protein